MFSKVSRALSRNVISSVALFVALGGTSYAAQQLLVKSVKTRHLANAAVTAKKIKGSAVTSGKVKDGSLLAKDFKQGELKSLSSGPSLKGDTGLQGIQGEAGLKGDVGEQGELGPQGAMGAPGVDGVSGYVEVVNSTDFKNILSKPAISSYCPDGKRVIAGGYRILPEDADVIVTQNGPTDGMAWTVKAKYMHPKDGNIPQWSVIVSAVCANLK